MSVFNTIRNLLQKLVVKIKERHSLWSWGASVPTRTLHFFFQLHEYKSSSHRIFRLNNIAKALKFLEDSNVSV